MKSFRLALLLLVALAPVAVSQDAVDKVVPAGSKVFIATMENGFDDYLKAALQVKKVPLVVVDNKDSADFEISGHSDTQKASTAKKVIMLNWQSNEQASIQVVNLKTSQVAFAYSVNKQSSAHGKKSTAEACAKHLKEKIESKK
ncbi:MAG TPA: hypothetical protein VFA67_08085 [Candidatus Sulfotelmatobacter sp.]|nr:hypothetical protein [Candidatus Sulfotelmatobacter sp.]